MRKQPLGLLSFFLDKGYPWGYTIPIPHRVKGVADMKALMEKLEHLLELGGIK